MQGVFYRQSTREKAVSLGLAGTVRNNPDGSVTVVASGDKEQLDELVSWCRQGPPSARVNNVVVREESLQSFNDFKIVR
ncbi:MAG: acylphosphatase [Bacteroidetes bacterium]|nr:acylphosphatase [Bacteroidota bacterium]